MYILQGLQLLGGRVQPSDHLGVLEVLLVVLHEHLTRLLVECALGEGDDEETLDHLEYVVEGPGHRIPILLQGINADLSLLGYVGMEDLSYEITWIIP